MNSWKNRFLSLSPSAMFALLSGCLAGENQTFFDYASGTSTSTSGTTVDPVLSDTTTGSTTGTSTDSFAGTDTVSATGTDTGTSTSSNTTTDVASGTGTGTETYTSTPTNTTTGTTTDVGTMYGYCCNTQSGHVVPASQTGCDHGVALIPVSSPNNCIIASSNAVATEVFAAAVPEVKKVDFLFVVDNSSSMADNQTKIAEGFENFANTYYHRADLDICTAIITSDRHLGRSAGSYQRERTIPCTKPANWNSMNINDQDAYIAQVIADFKNKVNVGTSGNGKELVGKSLVSYLYNLNAWNSTIDQNVRTSFFRADAVANISILTDENNWFYGGSNVVESSNDLPVAQNAPIYNSAEGSLDTRKGIKDYMDEFFTAAQPSHGLSYSVSSFLETSKGPSTIPGLAMNLSPLSDMVGRESAKADIQGDASSFAGLYHSVGDSIVQRAAAFNLSHSIYEPMYPSLSDLTVTLVKVDGSRVNLHNGTDYTVMMPNGISLNQSVSNTTNLGDRIEVQYRYGVSH